MKKVRATDFRHHFGEHLEGLAAGPVMVEKGGRPVAVLLSYQEYEHLQKLEDQIWGEMAARAKANGKFLGPEESMRFLMERLNAET